MAYKHLTLVHCKGQGEGHAYLDSEYLENGDTTLVVLIIIIMQIHIVHTDDTSSSYKLW